MTETPFLRETMRIQWETELKCPAEAISAGLRESKALQGDEGRNKEVGVEDGARAIEGRSNDQREEIGK
jgi:hypothetical protein